VAGDRKYNRLKGKIMLKKISILLFFIFATSQAQTLPKELTNKKIINFIKENDIKIASFDEVKEAVLKNIEGKGDTVIIDSRTKANFEESHIPTALNFDSADKVKMDKNRKIIVYCRGYGCGSAAVFTKALMNLGYKNVKTYLGGMPEWRKKFFREAGRSDFINGFYKHTVLFIDVRSFDEFLKGTIPGALWIEQKSMEKFEKLLPIDKNYPIVIFAKDENDKRAFYGAWKLFFDFGYKNTKYYKGGFESYKNERMPIAVSFSM
jgi:rhodanese-related sulfurtransferase